MDEKRIETKEEALFILAARECGWPDEVPVEEAFLRKLYAAYSQRLQEVTPYPFLEWDDEDADDVQEDISVLRPWADWWAEDVTDAAGSEQKESEERMIFRGAEMFHDSLLEVTEEAKRILNDLNTALEKLRQEQAEGYREMRAALAQVAALDKRQSPEMAWKRLAELEEVAYKNMVSKKGLFGIRSGAQHRIEELAKESWALAGQGQVDLDITALPAEDPRQHLDVQIPLIRQMGRKAEEADGSSGGRLQKLVRFDDLQADLNSQQPKRT